MKENESNLNEIIEVESSEGEENNKALKEEDVLKEEVLFREEKQIEECYEDYKESKEQKEQQDKEEQGQEEQTSEPDEIGSRDTSFKSYEREQNSKEKLKKRGFFAKLSRFCLITLGVILAIPLLAAGAMVIVGGLGASLGVIGIGIVSVVFAAFLMTVQPGLIGWLGVFVSVGLLSGGGLALCLVILLIRGMKYIVRILKNKDSEADFAVREER